MNKKLKKLLVINELDAYGMVPQSVLKYINVLGGPVFISPALIRKMKYTVSELSSLLFKPNNLIVGRLENPEMTFAAISNVHDDMTENLLTIMSLSQLDEYELTIIGNGVVFVNARAISGWDGNIDRVISVSEIERLITRGMSIFLEPTVFDNSLASGINNAYMKNVILYRGIVTNDTRKFEYMLLDNDLKIHHSTMEIEEGVTNINEIIRGYDAPKIEGTEMCVRFVDKNLTVSILNSIDSSIYDSLDADSFINLILSNDNNAFLIKLLDIKLFNRVINHLTMLNISFTIERYHEDIIYNS